MSYILDALKKSEQERKVGDFPDINSEHQLLIKVPQNETALVLKGLGFLLALLLFIAFVLFLFRDELKSQFSSSPKSEVIVVESIQTKPLTIIAPGQMQTEPEEVFEGEIIRPDPERRAQLQKNIVTDSRVNEQVKQKYEAWFTAEEAAIQAEKTRLQNLQKKALDAQTREGEIVEGNALIIGDTQKEASVTAEIVKDEPVPEPVEEELDWDAIPTIADLDRNDRNALPKIMVSTHIFSSAVSFRKVTVNGINMRAGDALDENLRLLAITDEGVVFQFKDKIFRMNALEEWKGM